MIADLIRLSALYVIVRVFVEIAMPSSRLIVKYLFWAAIALTLINAIGPTVHRLLDDIHNASVTYSKVKEGAEKVSNDINEVTSLPETLENIPLVGTGVSKYPPGITLMEKLRPSTIRFNYPLSGTITQEFKGAEHHGIDIDCKEGTIVKSSREGKVAVINSDNVYGKYVMVDHGQGWQTLYAHLSEVKVTKGQKLWGNSMTVGLSGNTGRSTGSHLHFEIRAGGAAINPKELMK